MGGEYGETDVLARDKGAKIVEVFSRLDKTKDLRQAKIFEKS